MSLLFRRREKKLFNTFVRSIKLNMDALVTYDTTYVPTFSWSHDAPNFIGNVMCVGFQWITQED